MQNNVLEGDNVKNEDNFEQNKQYEMLQKYIDELKKELREKDLQLAEKDHLLREKDEIIKNVRANEALLLDLFSRNNEEIDTKFIEMIRKKLNFIEDRECDDEYDDTEVPPLIEYDTQSSNEDSDEPKEIIDITCDSSDDTPALEDYDTEEDTTDDTSLEEEEEEEEVFEKPIIKQIAPKKKKRRRRQASQIPKHEKLAKIEVVSPIQTIETPEIEEEEKEIGICSENTQIFWCKQSKQVITDKDERACTYCNIGHSHHFHLSCFLSFKRKEELNGYLPCPNKECKSFVMEFKRYNKTRESKKLMEYIHTYKEKPNNNKQNKSNPSEENKKEVKKKRKKLPKKSEKKQEKKLEVKEKTKQEEKQISPPQIPTSGEIKILNEGSLLSQSNNEIIKKIIKKKNKNKKEKPTNTESILVPPPGMTDEQFAELLKIREINSGRSFMGENEKKLYILGEMSSQPEAQAKKKKKKKKEIPKEEFPPLSTNDNVLILGGIPIKTKTREKSKKFVHNIDGNDLLFDEDKRMRGRVIFAKHSMGVIACGPSPQDQYVFNPQEYCGTINVNDIVEFTPQYKEGKQTAFRIVK